MMKTTRLVTYTTLACTDGTTTIFGVYRAKLHKTHRPQKDQYIDMKAAVLVGQVVHEGDIRGFDYLGASEGYATADAPAFNWGRG